MAHKIETISFHSRLLGEDMGIHVYLPDAYRDSEAPLPVLYFLHGRNGNEDLLFDLAIPEKADQMIAEKRIRPMVIACPRIGNSRGINSSPECKKAASPQSGTPVNLGMYEDYLIKEVLPLAESRFHIAKARNSRMIGGVSGGGYAALHLAFRHQGLFSKVGGHMPAIELQLEEDDALFFPDISIWQKYDPISIARDTEIPKDLEVYLDAGTEDEGHFYEGCEILHQVLLEKGVPSQNHRKQGHHNLAYILSNIEDYLEFYGS